MIRTRDNREIEENLLIDEEYKHTVKISYRWLIFNAILQSICLLTICIVIFLLDLIQVIENGYQVHISVLYLEVED